MATPNSGKPTPARARRATQTIDELEARAAEIAEAEREAVCQVAELLRELAVTLPVESELPMRFAKTARMIGDRRAGDVGNSLAAFDLDELARDCSKDQELAAAVAMITAIDMWPRESARGRGVSELGAHLREIYGLA